MRAFGALVCLTVIFVGLLCGQTVPADGKTVRRVPVPALTRGPSEMACTLSGATASFRSGANALTLNSGFGNELKLELRPRVLPKGLMLLSGNVAGVSCHAVPAADSVAVALATTEIAGGLIKTADYGDLQLVVSVKDLGVHLWIGAAGRAKLAAALSTASQQSVANDFMPLDPRKLICSVPGVSVQFQDGQAVVHGSFDSLACHTPSNPADVHIPILSTDRAAGTVETKDFGPVKVIFSLQDMNIHLNMKSVDSARLATYVNGQPMSTPAVVAAQSAVPAAPATASEAPPQPVSRIDNAKPEETSPTPPPASPPVDAVPPERPAVQQATNSPPAPPAETAQFEPLDSAKIACRPIIPTIKIEQGAVTGGRIDVLLCHAPPDPREISIDLRSNDLAGGIIQTKDFGDVALATGVGGYGTYAFAMRPADETRLEQYLRGAQSSKTSPPKNPLPASSAAPRPAQAFVPQDPRSTCMNGSGEAAIGACTTLIKSQSTDQSDIADAYYRRAFDYYSAGQDALAIADYGQLIKLKPGLEKAYLNRGIAYAHTQQFGKAIADFNQAASLQPDDVDIFGARASAYVGRQQYQNAVQDYERIIARKPSDPDINLSCGLAYLQLGQYDRAIANLDQAIAARPDFTDALYARGFAQLNAGHADRAVPDFDRAIELKPGYSEAYAGRANAYDNLKQFNNAIRDYDEAIRLKPDFERAYNNRGIDYFNLKDFRRAVENFNEAINIKPDDAEVYYNRGLAYINMGEREKAMADYDIAISKGGLCGSIKEPRPCKANAAQLTEAN